MEKQTNITDVIKTEIKTHEGIISDSNKQISLLKSMMRVYQNGNFANSDVLIKRKYVKSGKYAKNLAWERKKLVGDLKVVRWKTLLVNALEQEGKPMTSKQIIARLFSGRHKQTLKVLKRRLSVCLAIYKKDGTLKTNKDGRGCKYGLPDMF